MNLVNRSSRFKYVETPTAKSIINLLDYCKTENDIGVIVGKPGVGKTTALKQYVLTGKAVTFCPMTPALNSMGALLKFLVAHLTGYHPESHLYANHELLMSAVENSQIGMLIIDEAQLLSDQIIDELRCLYDHNNFPLIFCGNAEFRSRFNNTKAASFTQFTSRVGVRFDIDEPRQGDIEAISDSLRIDQSVTARKYITDIAKSSGGLRIIGKIANLAGRGIGEKETIKLDRLKEAAKLLGAKP
ncbi:MAG: AAA family ATPase [Sneathiella sp.]|nr:AAA family ATPase [Sneathiella sp.]